MGEGAYLHVGDENATEVLVVGVAQGGMLCCWWGEGSPFEQNTVYRWLYQGKMYALIKADDVSVGQKFPANVTRKRNGFGRALL